MLGRIVDKISRQLLNIKQFEAILLKKYKLNTFFLLLLFPFYVIDALFYLRVGKNLGVLRFFLLLLIFLNQFFDFLTVYFYNDSTTKT